MIAVLALARSLGAYRPIARRRARHGAFIGQEARLLTDMPRVGVELRYSLEVVAFALRLRRRRASLIYRFQPCFSWAGDLKPAKR